MNIAFWSVHRLTRGVVSPVSLCCIFAAGWGGSALLSQRSLVEATLGGLAIGFLVASALVDAAARILPDPLLLGGAVAAGAAALCDDFLLTLVTSICCLGFVQIVYRTTNLGYGDVKLMGVLGLLLGQPELCVYAGIAGALGSSSWAILRAFWHRIPRTQPLALGPWLIIPSVYLWLIGS